MNGSQRVTKHKLHGNLADRMRKISLQELLRWHGFEIKPEGVTYRAKNDCYNIVVTGNRWAVPSQELEIAGCALWSN
jgi:hypothetical protein